MYKLNADKLGMTESQAYEAEIYWINYYNSTDKNIGYNLTLGGEACSKYSDKEILTAFEQEKSVTRASRAIGMDRNAFSRRL